METYQLIQSIAGLTSAVAIIAALVFYYRQVIAMQSQIVVAREASATQNLLTFATFLQDKETRNARKIVITKLNPTRYKHWTKSELDFADKVCSSYSVAGIVLRTGIVNRSEILECWGSSILQCYMKLRPHIEDRRKQAGPGYWEAFDWLFQQAEQIEATATRTPQSKKNA